MVPAGCSQSKNIKTINKCLAKTRSNKRSGSGELGSKKRSSDFTKKKCLSTILFQAKQGHRGSSLKKNMQKLGSGTSKKCAPFTTGAKNGFKIRNLM
jgi:hypothetical protein